MEKVIIKEPFKIEVTKASIPKLEPDSALIDTKYIGICGSDVIKFTGKYKNLLYPVIPGHEFTGVIRELKDNKSGFEIGDSVVINPNISCGKCSYCIGNKKYLCKNLKTLGANGIDGAMQSLINVPLKNIVKINNNDLMKLSLSEPLSVAIHPILDIDIEDKILFFGLGGIGTLSLIYLKGNIKNISIVELNKAQIKAGSSFGVDEVFDYNYLIKNSKKFNENFDDIIINCPLSQGIFDISTILAKRGGKIIIIGLSIEDIKVDFVKILNKEISIVTSFKFTEDDFNTAVNFLNSNNIEYMIKTKVFSLSDTFNAFKFKLDNPEFKVLLQNTE
jgi:2-desacetyl-2-hydroxyethyl bacteriochlorophyllide A dehydrogenase